MNSANSGSGIHFSLNLEDGAPIYRQIIQQIEYAVLSERLKAGDKLPTIRALAVSLKINPNTIAKAYAELEIRGVVATQVGSGTFISDKKPDSAFSREDSRNQKIMEVIERFTRELKNLGAEKEEIINLITSYYGG
jgi:GntR family transcriptional regulator